MRRREFLSIAGAAAIIPPRFGATPPMATVLCEDRSVIVNRLNQTDSPGSKDSLWIRKADLPRTNGFVVKPQGACRADVCIPIPKEITRGESFNLTAFARKLGQVAVVDLPNQVWSFGEIPAVQSGFLDSRIAPDFAVPDRKGRVVHLSAFRGKKVLVVTWASW
jgi:hypothetical protein